MPVPGRARESSPPARARISGLRVAEPVRAGRRGSAMGRMPGSIPVPRCLCLPAGILNFCANNYLGLSSHPQVIRAAVQALEEFGAGLSSVRFICGTQVLGTSWL